VRPLLQTGLALAVLIAANGLVAPPNRIEVRPDPRMQPRYRQRIEAERPEVVLIGNSILREGVDAEALSRRTGHRCLEVVRGGAASAWWYLALKNQVVAARPLPELVVIVFRDHFLTEPGFRVTGKYRRRLDALSGADEPVLARLAYGEAPGSLLERSLPLYGRRAELREDLERVVKDAWVGRLLGLEPGGVDAALERVFRREALDPARLGSLQAESEAPAAGVYAFGARVEHSFLPEIVEVARAHGVRLVFARAKRRRDLAPGAEPPELVAYLRDLEAWLAARGIPLLDFSHDPRLVEAHYADGDHLGPEGRRLFTELLAEALAPHLDGTGGGGPGIQEAALRPPARRTY
jgi:hypothetical protein